MTKGEDRNKDRFKKWKLCGVWSSRRTAFTLPIRLSIPLFCSDFRHSWKPPQGTWTSPPATVYFRSLAVRTG